MDSLLYTLCLHMDSSIASPSLKMLATVPLVAREKYVLGIFIVADSPGPAARPRLIPIDHGLSLPDRLEAPRGRGFLALRLLSNGCLSTK